MNTLTLTGEGLSIGDVERVADGQKVAIGAGAEARMAAARALVDRYVAEGLPAYGITTGLGVRATEVLLREELTAFSYRMIRGRAQSWGEPLEPRAVRAVMLARLNTLLSGAAGASPHVAGYLAEVLNRGLVPVVPRWASVGAGDLVAMAAIPHALIGEGEMLIEGKRVKAGEALQAAGLKPLQLGPKDGLILTNATSFSVGQAALAAAGVRRVLLASLVAAGLSLEGFRGNASPLSAPATLVRPQAGEVEAGAMMRCLLAGGLLLEDGAARRLQDPLSMRCIAQVSGSALAQLAALEAAIDIELNHSGDNPVVLVEDSRIVSTGNFHLPHLTLMLDAMARALAWVATDVVSRVARAMNASFSGLPPLLSSNAAGRAGFGPIMKPAEAVRGEIVHLANPVPVMMSHNADGVEDSLTFSALAASKLQEIVERMNILAAFELAAAAQAVDLAKPPRIGAALQEAHQKVRGILAFIDEDRPVGRDIEEIARRLVASGELARLIPQA